MAGSTRVWWDRDLDHGGHPIRPDVRSAGHEIWEQACRRTRTVVSDEAPAAELLENAVAQVSRYLDRIGAPVSPGKHGLLMAAFCRSLERYASRSARIELAGASTELQNRIADESWVARSNARLDLEIILRRLSGRNAQVLMLRAADYEWKEIADLLGTSAARVRNRFWREINKIRSNCALGKDA
jgi:DNA-directed RNA polymerase specialized sigma24 family protein